MSSAPSMRWSRTLTVFERSAPSRIPLDQRVYDALAPAVGAAVRSSGHARRGKAVSQRLVRKWTDGQGKRQKPFADLCLTTWLLRRKKRKVATHYGFGKSCGAFRGAQNRFTPPFDGGHRT